MFRRSICHPYDTAGAPSFAQSDYGLGRTAYDVFLVTQ